LGAWARTLPERHGGRGVLWALLGVLALAESARDRLARRRVEPIESALAPR